MPMSRVCGGLSVMSSPWRWMRPSVGFSRPAIILSNVVFPHPEGPRNEISFPSGSSSSTPATATTSANRLTTPSRVRPARCSTRLSAHYRLCPAIVDPVLPFVVDTVIGTQCGIGAGPGERLVLLVAEIHVLLVHGRRGAERTGQLRLRLRLTHEVDERDAGSQVLRGAGDRPVTGVEDGPFFREDGAERLTLRCRELGDVVVELPQRHFAGVELLLCLRLIAEPQLHVRLDLSELVEDFQDAVLRLQDLVAVEERCRGRLQQERVTRILEQRELVTPLWLPERRPRIGTLLDALRVRHERDVPGDRADSDGIAAPVLVYEAVREVLVVGRLGDVETRQDVALLRPPHADHGQHRDVRGDRARLGRLLELHDPL